jgi:predicted RNA-binding protein associated with RNAse of E/G family
VAWWVDDPTDKRLEIDVCLAPERTDDGWSYVDLELDPVRHANGVIEIQDHDEFVVACRDGWITAEDAAIADATAKTLATALQKREEPLAEEGWRRLADCGRGL